MSFEAINVFGSIDRILMGVAHAATVCNNAVKSGAFSDGTDEEKLESLAGVVEQLLAERDFRTMVAMYLIGLRGHELFCSGLVPSYDGAMVQARKEVWALLNPDVIRPLMRELMAMSENFQELVAIMQDSEDNPGQFMLQLLRGSDLVQTALHIAILHSEEQKAA